MRPLILVVALAACGGGKSSTPAPKEPEPVVSEKEPPLTDAQHAAAIEDLASRACACADVACFRHVDGELGEIIDAVAIETADAFDPQALESFKRYLACATELGIGSDLASFQVYAARLDEVAEAACACQDARCTNNVFGGLVTEYFAFGIHYKDDARMQAVTESSMKRITDCIQPHRDKVAQEAIVELTALRDAACACATAACADGVQTDFDAFLEKHKDTQGSEEQAETIGNVAKAMSECLAAAKGDAAP